MLASFAEFLDAAGGPTSSVTWTQGAEGEGEDGIVLWKRGRSRPIAFQVELKQSSGDARKPSRWHAPADAGGTSILLAPYLSPSERARLKDMGWSYWDATGNASLRVDSPMVLIEREGAQRDPAPSENSDPQRLRSLKGAAAGRVVVQLLSEGGAESVRALAVSSSVGVGTAARVLGLLREERQVAENGGAFRVGDRKRLARRWAADYSFIRTSTARRFSSLLGRELALERVAGNPRDVRVTGVAAASRLLSARSATTVLPGAELWLLSSQPSIVARELELVTDSRGDVLLGAGKLDRDALIADDGLPLATPWRVVGDLLSSAGRTVAVGEQLMAILKEGGFDG